MSIPAQFETSCPACERRIRVDDQIAANEDNRWVHVECVDREPAEPRNPTCPACFIQHAGECA